MHDVRRFMRRRVVIALIVVLVVLEGGLLVELIRRLRLRGHDPGVNDSLVAVPLPPRAARIHWGFTLATADDPAYAALPALYRPAEAVLGCRVQVNPNITELEVDAPLPRPRTAVLRVEAFADPDLARVLAALQLPLEIRWEPWGLAHALAVLGASGSLHQGATGLLVADDAGAVSAYLRSATGALTVVSTQAAASRSSAPRRLSFPERLRDSTQRWATYPCASLDFILVLIPWEPLGGQDLAAPLQQLAAEAARAVRPNGTVVLQLPFQLTGADTDRDTARSRLQLHSEFLLHAAAYGLELEGERPWATSPHTLLTAAYLGAEGAASPCAAALPQGVVCQHEPDTRLPPVRCVTAVVLVLRKASRP